MNSIQIILHCHNKSKKNKLFVAPLTILKQFEQDNIEYKIEKDMLFTKLPRENEMMVKIVTLNTDSLVFDMSRSGTDETLFLIREKPDSTGRVP